MWRRRMLSESCRPALNLTNHTPKKDSEGLPELETEEEGWKKKKESKRVGCGGREADRNECDNRVRTEQERSWEKWGGKEREEKERKNCPVSYCHIINCSNWSSCGKFKTGAIFSQRLVARDASSECWWARHEESNPFSRHGACHWIPLRLHCVTRNIQQ